MTRLRLVKMLVTAPAPAQNPTKCLLSRDFVYSVVDPDHFFSDPDPTWRSGSGSLKKKNFNSKFSFLFRTFKLDVL